MSDWKRERNERAVRDYVRKTTDAAYLRIRTAKEQQADALAALKGPGEIPLPDADDSGLRGVMR